MLDQNRLKCFNISMSDYFSNCFEPGGKYLVAVSGGIDSVVLLDKLSKLPHIVLMVAHFDHQIRGDSSANDARLVRQLAKKYNLPYFLRRGGLGAQASEEQARTARYQFLRQIAKEQQAQLVVAHHFDDVIETIAINLKRGTGWQGLAVMDAPDIIRPMINLTKTEIRQYATDNNLTWNEDETNSSDAYLRNRLRRSIEQKLPFENKLLLFDCYLRQKALKQAIFAEAKRFYNPKRVYRRYFFIMIDFDLAVELLRIIIKLSTGKSVTIPQAKLALIAIKTNKAGTKHQLASGISFSFSEQKFELQTDF